MKRVKIEIILQILKNIRKKYFNKRNTQRFTGFLYRIPPQELDMNLQQISLDVLFLTTAAVFVHYLTRGRHYPEPKVGGRHFVFYTRWQRLFHWITFLLMSILALTGFTMLLTGNYSTLNFHNLLGLLLSIPFVGHLIFDFMRRSGRAEMTIRVRELMELIRPHGVKGKIGGKYHPLKKMLHLGFSLSFLGLALTGVPMFLFPTGLGPVAFTYVLDLHVLSALMMVGLGIGHIYMAFLPSNKPLLMAVTVGLIDEEYLKAHYETASLNLRPVGTRKITTNLSRRIFLESTVLASVLALMAGILAGSISQRNGGSPSSSQLQAQGEIGPIANVSQLKPNTAKMFSFPNGAPGIVVELPNTQLKAFSAVCTHQGCTVGYIPEQQIIYCPCHGAEFSPQDGSVIAGPAPAPLTEYPIVVDQNTGNVYIQLGSNSSPPPSRGGGDDGGGGDD